MFSVGYETPLSSLIDIYIVFSLSEQRISRQRPSAKGPRYPMFSRPLLSFGDTSKRQNYFSHVTYEFGTLASSRSNFFFSFFERA